MSSTAPHPITLRQLQYVVAVADRRGFRRAAEDCRVSQPSLSAQIAQVEDALGVKLFDRDRRRVVLTRAGELFVERARRVLYEADELVEETRRLRDPFSGTVRLGVIPTVGPYLLPDLAPALRERYPRLSVAWFEDKTEALVRRLRAGELDGAVLALGAETAGLAHLEIGRDPFVLATSRAHRLGKGKTPVRPEALEGERVLLLDDGHCFRDQALAYCSKAGASEREFRATSLATLVQMTAGGGGVTLLPRVAIDVENRRDDLHVRPFAPDAPHRVLVLAWRKGASAEPTLRGIGETMARAYAARRERAEPRRARR